MNSTVAASVLKRLREAQAVKKNCAESFDAAEAIRQNLEWEARERRRKEYKRARHNALVD